jgi:hypothetical protein
MISNIALLRQPPGWIGSTTSEAVILPGAAPAAAASATGPAETVSTPVPPVATSLPLPAAARHSRCPVDCQHTVRACNRTGRARRSNCAS